MATVPSERRALTRRASAVAIVTALSGLLAIFGLLVLSGLLASPDLPIAAPAAAQPTSTSSSTEPVTTTTEPPSTASTATTPPPPPPTSVVTTTVPASTTAPSSTTSTSTTSTTVATGSKGSSSNTAAIVTAIIVVVAVALIALLVALLVRRRRRAQWWTQARLIGAEASALASAVERGVPLLRDPGAAAQVWGDLNSRVTHLRLGFNTLAQSAPEGRAKAITNRASLAVEAMQAAMDTDRSLRIGPPPPTPEQLGYSEALLRQRAAELERTAQELEVAAPANQ